MRLGIDLGGTKIEAIVLSDDGLEQFRKRVPTPDAYEDRIAAIATLVADAETAVGTACTIGIGTPGSLSPHSGMMQNAENLIGKPLQQDLERALDRPIRLANDANCFALSEATDGAGAGAALVFGVILGTGVGGGIVASGQLLDGPNGITGEWGHNPLPDPDDDERPGPACYCGRHGCIETFLNGRGLVRAYETVTGTTLPAEEIAAGDTPQKITALEHYERRLAKALAGVINVIDPNVIVLGGGLSNIDRFYETVPALWHAWVFSDGAATCLAKARHGDSSGVRGAAWLWNEAN